MPDVPFEIVVAWCRNPLKGIGFRGNLPWRLPSDLRRFKQITTQEHKGNYSAQSVVMGRLTWESIPEKFRPLPKRVNVVLTTQEDYEVPEGVFLAFDFQSALKIARSPFNRLETRVPGQGGLHKVSVIGGSSIYEQALADPGLIGIHQTIIEGEWECDTFLPGAPQGHWIVRNHEEGIDNGVRYRYELLSKEDRKRRK